MKFCNAYALDGTEGGIVWDSCDLEFPDIKSDLEESADLECETGCTNEEDSDYIR
jgi:hypothetical protein